MFSGKGALEICSKFTGEHQCRSVILIKFQSTLRYRCSPVNVLRIFKIAFPKNTPGRLLLKLAYSNAMTQCITRQSVSKRVQISFANKCK